MKLAWTALVLGLAFAAGAAPQDDLKKILPDVEGVKRSARKISKEAREKIEKALERALDDKEANAAIWEGRASVPEANASEKIRVLYTVVAGKGPKGEFKIAVAVAPEERVIAGVRMIENKDDPAIASGEFLDQFEMFRYTANVSNPASTLEEARKVGAARKDDRAKQIDGIFKLHAIMHPVDAAWKRLQRRLDEDNKEAAADAAEVARLFGEAEKLLPDFTFLRVGSVDSFRRRLKESAKELGTLAQHAKAGKMVEARNVAAEVAKMSCSQCHAGTERQFREKRLELGMGNGYFAVGLDVEATEGPVESLKAAAAAIRQAVLILAEAK